MALYPFVAIERELNQRTSTLKPRQFFSQKEIQYRTVCYILKAIMESVLFKQNTLISYASRFKLLFQHQSLRILLLSVKVTLYSIKSSFAFSEISRPLPMLLFEGEKYLGQLQQKLHTD